jgi:ATP-dependent Lhr-like helicase
VGAADELQWCDRYVLERIHRRTLNRLRAEVEPCGDAEFAAFRFRWAHIVDSTLPGGVDGVRTVLEQMQGLAFAPEFWERSVLRSRVLDYRPEYLDLLCMSGEFAWTAPPQSNEDGERPPDFPARVSFVPRGSRLHAHSGPLPDESAARAVADTLSRFGAQYLDQIADRAGISERDALSALWRLAAAGAVSNDSFAPLRLLWSDHRSHDAIAGGRAVDRHDAALRARLKSRKSRDRTSSIKRASSLQCCCGGTGFSRAK